MSLLRYWLHGGLHCGRVRNSDLEGVGYVGIYKPGTADYCSIAASKDFRSHICLVSEAYPPGTVSGSANSSVNRSVLFGRIPGSLRIHSRISRNNHLVLLGRANGVFVQTGVARKDLFWGETASPNSGGFSNYPEGVNLGAIRNGDLRSSRGITSTNGGAPPIRVGGYLRFSGDFHVEIGAVRARPDSGDIPGLIKVRVRGAHCDFAATNSYFTAGSLWPAEISEVFVPVAYPAATNIHRAIAGVATSRADLDEAARNIYPWVRLGESSLYVSLRILHGGSEAACPQGGVVPGSVNLSAANVDSDRRVFACPIGLCTCRKLNRTATSTDESSTVSTVAYFGEVDSPAFDIDSAPSAPGGLIVVVEPAGISIRVHLEVGTTGTNQGSTFGRPLEV